jgi:PAS domain S-box-containing protein
MRARAQTDFWPRARENLKEGLVSEANFSLAELFNTPPAPPNFQVLFESAPGLYLVLTPDFRIVAASDAYLRGTMTKREEVLGRVVFDVFPDNPQDPTASGARNLRESLERVLRNRVADAMAVQKYDIRRPQECGGGFEERYWSFANSPVFGAGQEVAYIIHRVDDVTEFVHLKLRGIEQERLTQKLLTRGEQMEAEIFLRGQEIQENNRRLREVNEALQKEIAWRHRAEEKLKKAHEKLEMRYQASNADLARANEKVERLAAIVESSEDAIIGLLLDGTVLSWNAGAERVYGYTAAEMIGQSGFVLVPEDRRHEFGLVWEKIKQGKSMKPFEIQGRGKDGKQIPLWLSISTIRNAAGRIVGASTIAREMGERKRLEQQLHQAQKMEAIGQLAGGVAHDFNNLLTIISGYSDILLANTRADDPAKGLLAEIRKAGEQAASLTRQLLAFSRKQVLEPKILDLNSIVAGTEKMLRRLIGEDVSLTSHLAPKLGQVRADAGQMEQVIMNLVVNARDAMPQGGNITIETGNVDLDPSYCLTRPELAPGRYAMLAVSDNGCGMDEETKARIFEPFFTTKGPGKGTGLGLATVYGIVKQSGGYIYVYSEPNLGATFKIYLPLIEDQNPAARLNTSSKPIGHGQETILLVEDEVAVREFSRYALQSFGYAVLEARNGPEAIRLCEQYQGTIHLLVSDVVMPQMGGRQVAQRITAMRPGLKVLFLSGYTDDAVVRHGVLQAETAFLQKPFMPATLANKVREILDQRQESGVKPRSDS